MLEWSYLDPEDEEDDTVTQGVAEILVVWGPEPGLVTV